MEVFSRKAAKHLYTPLKLYRYSFSMAFTHSLLSIVTRVVRFLPYLAPWLAGVIIIRMPESLLLLETVVSLQFWYLALSSSTVALVTVILQGIYDRPFKKDFLSALAFFITLVGLLAGTALAFEAMRARVDFDVFQFLLATLCSIVTYLVAKRASHTILRIGASFLMGYAAAYTSLILYSGSVSWQSSIISLSFGCMLAANESFILKFPKFGSAMLVLIPVPVAWLVSLTVLPYSYLLSGLVYLRIARVLEKTKDGMQDTEVILTATGQSTLIFLILLLCARFA